MNRWAKVLKVICEEALKEGREIYVVEGDSQMRWFGLSLKDLCSDSTYSMSDPEIYRIVKAKITEEVRGGGFMALVNPVNMYADIYESSRPLFASSHNRTRPYDVTRDHFRVGFFPTKEEAVDFFLRVSQRLREAGITFHIFYR
jgi:hypothetical protein